MPASKKKHRQKGICHDCPKEALPGKSRCLRHRDKSRHADRKRYARYRAEDRCAHCGAPALEGKAMCAKHRKRKRKPDHTENASSKARRPSDRSSVRVPPNRPETGYLAQAGSRRSKPLVSFASIAPQSRLCIVLDSLGDLCSYPVEAGPSEGDRSCS